jgi:hypothetical protein
MSRSRGPAVTRDGVILSGPARVDLLPDEVRSQRRQGAQRGLLGLAVLAALGVAVAASVGAGIDAGAQQAILGAAQARSQQLLAQQGKYQDVRDAQTRLGAVTAAQKVAAASDIDWSARLRALRSALPHDAAVTAVTMTAASPILAFPQSTVPLQGARLASMKVTVHSESLPDLARWSEAIESLPGVAEAIPSQVSQNTAGGYDLQITVYLDAQALSHRFATKEASK